MAARQTKTAAPLPAEPEGPRWHLSRTISLDSVIVLIVSIVSGLVFVLTMNSKIAQQEVNLANVQKLVERVEVDQKERMARLERDQAERSTRLENALRDQQTLFQSQILPKFRR